MAEVVRLTGIEQAQRCLAAARTATDTDDALAWLRLHRIYMTKFTTEEVASRAGQGSQRGSQCRQAVGRTAGA